MVSKREQHCAEMLCSFLKGKEHRCDFIYGPDPPDFIFNVDSERWAVEHTRLEERVKGIKKTISRERCIQGDFGITENLKEKLEGKIQGVWFLEISGPLQAKERRVIEKAAFQIISDNQEARFREILLIKVPRLIGETDLDDSVILTKVSNEGSSINCGSGLAGISSSTIHNENSKSIEYMISKKKPKLSAFQGQYEVIALLLESHLSFGDHQRIHEILQERKGELDWVDKVFLVFYNHVAQIL